MKSMFDNTEAMDFIGRRLREIEDEKVKCASRTGDPVEGCWCVGSGPNGTKLPCPPEAAGSS